MCTFDSWCKELSETLAGKKEAGCHVNTCGFLICVYYSFLLGFSALFEEKITLAFWVQEYSWWQAMGCPAQPGLLAFLSPLSQKRKAWPLLALSANGDKEESMCRLYVQNGEQAGLANRSGKVGRGSVSSPER